MTGRKAVLVKRGSQPAGKPVTAPRKLSDRELREQWQRERREQSKGKAGWARLWR